jgi:uroporphyrin-III C-methyltransferase / precorrin-2 dehydrogenase / sirohydrochlorin ferrochelatase
MSTGFVSIVGAGPGDPDLLTRRAVDRLERADLVLYDALASPEIVSLATRAQRFYVGKRAGRHSMAQRTIEQIMVRAARRGVRVVRLKAGDPFVFGRGGEEALALAEAGVPFEVIPGVSSAIAAPALAGVPVTHRGLASSFLCISGHDPEAFITTAEKLSPGSTTLVIMMGLRQRGTLARLLVERGWPKELPVAISWAASTSSARHWYGTLGEMMAFDASDGGEDEAGTIVVGEVVRVALQTRTPLVAGDTDASHVAFAARAADEG